MHSHALPQPHPVARPSRPCERPPYTNNYTHPVAWVTNPCARAASIARSAIKQERSALFLLAILLSTTLRAAQPQPLDTNWKFTPTDPKDAPSPTLDDSSWSTLDLPHDYSIAG